LKQYSYFGAELLHRPEGLFVLNELIRLKDMATYISLWACNIVQTTKTNNKNIFKYEIHSSKQMRSLGRKNKPPGQPKSRQVRRMAQQRQQELKSTRYTMASSQTPAEQIGDD
jgi:hypothetical protein